MFSTLLGYAGIHGAKGGTLLQFLRSVIRFYQSRRTAYYNPRVKARAPVQETEENGGKELPREKLKRIFSSMHQTSSKRLDQPHEDNVQEAEDGNLFFEEDIGIVETPVDYMTPKEYRTYQKKLRQEERRQREEEIRNLHQKGKCLQK
ncbi:MAG: hypothetical protein ACI4WR_05275, partial [Bulleidia sp.]